MVESDQMEEPILARLFFEVPPEWMAEFEVVYRDQLLPVLQKRGLTETSERGRATPTTSSADFLNSSGRSTPSSSRFWTLTRAIKGEY